MVHWLRTQRLAPLLSAVVLVAVVAVVLVLVAGRSDRGGGRAGTGPVAVTGTAPGGSSTSPAPPTVAATGGVSSPAEPTERQRQAWADAVPCPAPRGAPTAPREQLAGFAPVAAVRCSSGSRMYPDGEWTVNITSVASDQAGLQHLVGLLDRPDKPMPPNIACAAVLVVAPPLVLIDADGNQLRPRFPLDECQQPMADALAAADRLDWQQVTVARDRLSVPRAALDAHCPAAVKDLVWVAVQSPSPRWRQPGPVAGSGPAHICVYEHRSDPMAGEFVRGLTLDEPVATKLRAALGSFAGSDALTACAPSERFALVDNRIWVELGGCHRTADLHTAVGRSDPLVAELIANG